MSIQIYFEISVFNLWVANTSLLFANDGVCICSSFNVFASYLQSQGKLVSVSFHSHFKQDINNIMYLK